jgi:pilus assembly protein CpaF
VRNAKTIAFFSSKGGVGKSVLAVNTAIVLSKESDKKVLLMDMDLQFGDISMMVNKYNEKTILDAVEDGQIDSYENIKPYLYKYNDNLDIFFAPQKPEAAEYITKEAIEKIMKDVRKEYDVIVVDTGINFNEISEHNQELKQKIDYIVTKHIEMESLNMTNNHKKKIKEELLNEIIGFGPITGLLSDNSVTEIMVNGPEHVYIEKNGKLVLTDARFKDDNHVLHVIKKIVAPIGRRIDESSPMVDARLPNGSRVNAIISPLAIDGPSITIRKFAKDPFKVEDLVNFRTMTQSMAKLIKYCVEGRLNIVVSGGTGSGKTTTLNVFSSFIPENERIVTIEDAAELQLSQEHVVRLETRPANVEGKGEVTCPNLYRSLRIKV